MRIAVFHGNQHITVGRTERPVVAPGDVLLRVRRTALCGSDTKLWHKGASYTPGHEIFGVVEQPGHPVHGRRALVYIPVHCGYCASCVSGDTHLCQTESVLIGWNRPGGYAEALAVPEQCLLLLPDDIDDDLAPLLLDTISTAAHGLRLAQPVVSRGRVLVLGAGPVGLGAVLAAQALGYTDISVSDPRAARLALAERLGAKLHAMDDMSTRFDLVVEASGAHAARNRGMQVVAGKGVLLLIGENDNPWTIEETKPIRRKDFFMLRSFYFPKGDFVANLELLRANREKYRLLVDATFGLDELPEQFATFARGDLVKPLLAFD